MYQDPESHIRPLAHAFTFNREDARHGILLLHGFADSPYSMRDLATFLHDNGYSVSVPRLPGHGTRMSDFAQTQLSDWRQCVRRSLDELNRTFDRVTILARSFSGALALLELLDRPQAADQLVLVATPAWFRRDRMLFSLLPFARPLLREIRKPWVTSKELVMRMEVGRYPSLPTKTLMEFLRLLRTLHMADLRRVTTPTLIVHGKDDVVSSPDSANVYFERLESAEKELLWLDNTSHVPSSIHQNPLFQRRLLEFLGS